jgi:hypothetical protein
MLELQKPNIDFFKLENNKKSGKVIGIIPLCMIIISCSLFIAMGFTTYNLYYKVFSPQKVTNNSSNYFAEMVMKKELLKNIAFQSDIDKHATANYIVETYRNEIKQLVKHYYIAQYKNKATDDFYESDNFVNAMQLSAASNATKMYYHNRLRNFMLVQKSNDHSLEVLQETWKWIQLSKKQQPYLTEETQKIIHSISLQENKQLKQYLEENQDNINRDIHDLLEKSKLEI